ncbi:EAL domain-containing protein [Chroococcidiopsis sp. CCMEE 29]|uniref:EAL domain-containing protein n=1 Tax=Chroococcidiopsis sp. CCMEE 29 TaxID=155894 RepID=UPI00201FD907|nr:EAL domain-containing protein [Chroococcidiopsis sp. CCMEE 29]
MTIRRKTLLIVGMTLVSLMGVLYAASATILLSGFAKVEEQDTRQNVKRVQDALSEELAKLNLTTRDWAEWDDTYAFIEDANKAYVRTYLSDISITRLKLNLMLYVHSSGQVVFSKGFDLERQQEIPNLDNFQQYLAANSFLHRSHLNSYLTGVILLPEGPILIAARPILDSNSKGPSRGTLIMGRYLDTATLMQLAGRTHLSITAHRFDQEQMPPDFQAVRSSLSKQEKILVRPLNKQTVAGYTVIPDIYGKPALLLRVDSPRLIYKQGQASIRYFVFSLLVVGLVFGIGTLLLLEKLVLSRLSRLSADVSSIGTSGELSARVLPVSGRDELSSLASTINEMLAALEEVQHQQRDSEERFHRYNNVLAALAKRKILACSDLKASLREIIEASAQTLEVERACVWLHNKERSKMQCIDLYERFSGKHSEGIEIAAANCPVYFKTLEQERAIAAHDALTDPRTKEFSQLYLLPLGITSMLDTPLWVDGQMIGVICHEHIGDTRQWLLEEQNFAASIADLVAIAIESCERQRSQEALQTAYEELELRVRERTVELAKVNENLQSEIIERKIVEAKLIHDAFHDSLTSLPNRALFMDRLGRAVERAKRHKNYFFAVLFLDLDRFKLVNDSLGHHSGDQLLIAIARRLEACLRPGDTVARIGGDEFTILLDDIKAANVATQVAERIQKELFLPFNLNENEVFTTVSIGIALSTKGYDQPEDLLRDADVTMYRAKALGKARYEVFDTTMHTKAVELLQLENDLQRAIQRQEFRIDYQPIVSLKNGRVNGFEALLRWRHPERGLVSPSEFIPVAEETGLIVPLGWWVLREACRQTRAWQDYFVATSPLTISVNFSAKQFSQPYLVERIEQILQETELDAHCLKLEITESVIMGNAESAAAILLRLRMLGVQLYIDDFGTGYSSLSYLHRFPIDALKIDRSFVTRMGSDNENLEIVRTIMTMAHNLKMHVVAEGVETAEQLAQLRALQCEYGQGYLFSKPLPLAAASALIDEETALLKRSHPEAHDAPASFV